MVFTNDASLGTIARQLRNHGESERYVHERVGGNFRLDTMKAAILLIKLRHLDEFTRRRRRNAARYDDALSTAPITMPHVPDSHQPVYHQYTIACDRRDELRSFLADHRIGSAVYYPVPLHLQACFGSLGYRRGALPVTERLCERVLSLPCHPMLEDEDLDRVSSCIHEFYGVGEQAAASGNVTGCRCGGR